jgi:hypothetical protein
MRRLGGTLVGLGLLVAAMLGTAGCQWLNPAPENRPPKQPENFSGPPANDSRFDSPPKWPDRLLNQDATGPKDTPGGLGAPGSMSGPGMNRTSTGSGGARPY